MPFYSKTRHGRGSPRDVPNANLLGPLHRRLGIYQRLHSEAGGRDFAQSNAASASMAEGHNDHILFDISGTGYRRRDHHLLAMRPAPRAVGPVEIPERQVLVSEYTARLRHRR